MRINNVGLTPNQKCANPFKTSRNSTTNPFQNVNFEGNTLQFADVFEGFQPKNTSKLKMITSSVAGSMTKLRNSITEPIVNFVKRIGEGLANTRIGEGISNAWNYAKNKDVSDLAGVKAINNVMSTDIVDIGKGISNLLSTDVSTIGRGLYSKMSIHNKAESSSISNNISEKKSLLNTDVTEIGKGLAEKWNALISKVNSNNNTKISKDTPVAELKARWENEIKLAEEKEAA